MFNKNRLSLARKRKKLTKKYLASLVGISPLTLTRLENGDNEPEESTVKKLSDILDFPYSFFFTEEEVDTLETSEVSFRSLSSLSAKDRDSSLASGEIGFLISKWVSKRFNLPQIDLPNLSEGYTPEAAAITLRKHWGMGNKPVDDIIKLLESKGIVIFSLNEEINTVDAFSCWKNSKPYVFLNSFKTPERSRFDAAHELAHLVLHVGQPLSNDKETEREADKFASAFLMPESDIRSHIQAGYLSLDSLINKKKRWKVSLMALCYRIHKLGIISDWQYRTYCIDINKQFKRTEPESIQSNGSSLWKMVFTELWKDKVTQETISSELNIPLKELESLTGYFHSNLEKPSIEKSNLGLRLVK